jgi:NADH-quinone oxidoreductase subunit A
MLSSYSLFMYYVIICVGFVSLLLVGSFLGVFQNPEVEKNSVYECGFNPFFDARCKFEVRFYVVGLLFLIFDLELMFLFP